MELNNYIIKNRASDRVGKKVKIVRDFGGKLKGRGQECPLDFLAIFKVLKNS